MGTGDDTDTAASRLHQLNAFYREHPVSGPEGHSYIGCGSRPTAVHPGLPFRPAVVEHIDAAVAEVVAYTRGVNPDAEPLQGHVAGVYDWCRENTQLAPEVVQQSRRVLELRHRLEHAVRAGDGSVVRPHRCLCCRTLGLHWPEGVQDPAAKATCVNVHCAHANGGRHRTWALAELAFEQARVEKTLRDCAT